MQAPRSSSRLSDLLVSLAFTLTGVGTAILGSILPAVLAEWHLSDRSGGSLLFAAFAGSTVGAAIVHRQHRFLPAAGLLLCALGTALAALLGAHVARAGFLLYGLGLGVTMTAISMQRSFAVGPAGNHHEMNRLNLLWALGACCAPPLALHSLQRVSVDLLLRSGCFVLLLSGLALALLRSAPGAGDVPPSVSQALAWAPLRLCLFAGTAVALEAAIGSWLTTYTQRRAETAAAISATAIFWLGLLLSRLVHATRLGRILQTRRGLLLHLGCAALASALLISLPQTTALFSAALLAGWGLGPLYPLALSVALPQYRSGGVFVAAGLGSSLLPWLTGSLSTTLHSLRAGMLAPCLAVVLLIASGLSMEPHTLLTD